MAAFLFVAALPVFVGLFHLPPDLQRYRADDSRVEAAHIRPEVVFAGDSITDYWPRRAPATWDPTWVNRGIVSDTSRQLRARFAQDVLALHPRTVVILIGTNDIWGEHGLVPMAETEANIQAMAAGARAEGARVVIGTLPPSSPWVWPPMWGGGERAIQQLNRWVRAYAAFTKATVADFAVAMDPRLTVDGIHPSTRGYAVMSSVIRRALAASAFDRLDQGGQGKKRS